VDNEQAALRHRFRAVRVDVDQVVPAFSGLYPLFGGYSNWELVYTRDRLIARSGARLDLWAGGSRSGPGRRIHTYSLQDIVVTQVGRWRYGRVRLGDKRLWIHARYQPLVEEWMRSPTN
jgi:hypothetical protein